MRQNQKGNAMVVVLCVLSVVIILGLSMAAISSGSRSATVKNQHNQQAYYTARSVLDSVVLMLQESGDANNIAGALNDDPKDNKTLTAEGNFQGMGSYTVTMTLTDKVERIPVLEPVLDMEGEQKTDENGKLIYKEKQVVSRLPLKITVQSQYKDSTAMVSAYIDGSPVLGQAPEGGTNDDPEKDNEVSGDVDPIIQGLFPYVIGMRGTIGNMNSVTIKGNLYAAGAIGYLTECNVQGNIYAAATLSVLRGTIAGEVYVAGNFAPVDTTITGDVYVAGNFAPSNTTITGKTSIFAAMPVPPPATIGEWKPSVAPSKLDTKVDATKGPVYLWTDATEISNLTIEGDYPVYIQVSGASLHIDTKSGAINGASNTQVFYLCSDSVSNVTIGSGSVEEASNFYGYIYAPQATITVNKNITVNGALSGSSLTVTGDGQPDNITLNYQPPKGNHPNETVPLPDDGDDSGSGGGDSSGDSDKDDPLNPDDTKDKVVEKYEWPVTGYQGGAA